MMEPGVDYRFTASYDGETTYELEIPHTRSISVEFQSATEVEVLANTEI